MRRATALLLFFMSLNLVLSGCHADDEKRSERKAYFDMKGFVDNQIVYLNDKNPPLDKQAVLDGKQEKLDVKSVDWKKELELFAQADINKPAYSKSYAVDSSAANFLHYSIKTEEKLPVQDLQIRLDSLTKTPVYIRAILKSENRIYQSEKTIELRCLKKNNLWEIESYSISGFQKLMFMDKRTFSINSKIGL